MVLRIRPATAADCLPILDWRNDVQARAMSRNTAEIDSAGHEAWYARALSDPARLLLIGETEDGPVAMIRFDHLQAGRWEVSIVLAAPARGRGQSKLLLKMALDHFASQHAAKTIVARIKPENTASLRLFAALGFQASKSEDGMFLYLLPMN
ncbi:GNAT family N-acetyltransferase [Herbaspirillum sp. CAH-3]|uniref:GNAT family N-acetyltransferase n=1 Tax=Herbaspirillum sp. CAH-3 TaxID=2605746 RepID=UPI00189D7AD2|nr:GNAT family N-acetyltransferase [Herbaspirillum sp. CAH-3]